MQERFDLDHKEPISIMLLERMVKMGNEPGDEWDKAVEVVFE